MMNKPLILIGVSLAAAIVLGCDGQDGFSNEATSVAADAGSFDSGASSPPPIGTTPTTTADPKECSPPLVQKERCGKCGFRSRSCEPSGRFGSWGSCLDQREGQDFCNIGETRSAPCGNCGLAIDRCDPNTCMWTFGQCEGEGCKTGEYDYTTASCSTPGQVRTRQCDSKCSWGSFTACGERKGWLKMPDAPVLGRVGHVAVWTGTRMLVWGGAQDELKETFSSVIPAGLLDGASYDPVANAWTKLPPIPSSVRAGYSGASIWSRAVWTGTEMIVWGGLKSTGDGLAFNPATNTWRRIATSPAGRFLAAAVWAPTVNRMIVWGGYLPRDYLSSPFEPAQDANALAYDPANDTWETLAEAPVPAAGEPTFGWNGKELVVWSGGPSIPFSGAITKPRPALRFDPQANAWTAFASFPSQPDIGTGFGSAAAFSPSGELYSWGGAHRLADLNPTDARGNRDYGVSFGGTRLGQGAWSVLPRPDATLFNGGRPPFVRQASWFGGGRFWVWSGRNILRQAVASGASFDPATGTWMTMPELDAPPPRFGATTVWTGERAIIWGGTAGGTGLKSGGVYLP